MTVSTLRPSATSSNTGSVTGAGSAHAALSDNSDSSYVDFDNFETWVGAVDDLTLPAGAALKGIALRARVAASAGVPRASAIFPATDTAPVVGSPLVSWGVPTTVTFGVGAPSVFTDAAMDAGTLSLGSGPSFGATARFYEAYVDVTYVTKPTLTVDLPAGTITNTNLPTVSWTSTLDADGGPQSAWRVRVFSAAQYGGVGFDPATSTATVDPGPFAGAATSWQVSQPLADGAYRAYVTVAQLVNGVSIISDSEYAEFTVDVDLPGVPTIAATVDTANGRIAVIVSGNSGTATTDYFNLERSTDAGATWTAARHSAAQAVGGLYPAGSFTVYDYEAPNGTETQYRARALHNYSGVLAASDWATDADTWDSAQWWLKHPTRPELNAPVAVHSFPSVSRAGRMGSFQPLGASTVVVVSDTRGPKTGQITLRSDTEAHESALDALLDTQATLLLDGPADERPPGYLRISDHDRQRFVDRSNPGAILEQLSFVSVTRLAGDVVAWPP